MISILSIKLNVLVVIGAGGIGLPIARRLGGDRHIYLASYSPSTIKNAESSLRSEDHTVSSIQAGISVYSAVESVAKEAASLGQIDAIVLTSGVKNVPPKQIYEIDLLVTANVIDAFLPVVEKGVSMVCISSMAASIMPISPELEKHLATAPRDQLFKHPEIDLEAGPEGMSFAYTVAKRGNQLSVQSYAVRYGRKGARINSVSPRVIMTKMGKESLEGPCGVMIQGMVDGSAVGRVGTPEEVVDMVAFLASRQSSLIAGTDILVDGGTIASVNSGSSCVVRCNENHTIYSH